jgi:hypothetical protein
MYRFPAASITAPVGKLSCAVTAEPPSPENPAVPLPATVVAVPPGTTFKMRLSKVSAIYRAPAASTARPDGLLRNSPDIGTLEMMPAGVTLRMRLFKLSAMYRLPVASSASPEGTAAIGDCTYGAARRPKLHRPKTPHARFQPPQSRFRQA